jgi:hypothetical protein
MVSDHKDKLTKSGNRQHKAMLFRISESNGLTNTFTFNLIFKRINILWGGGGQKCKNSKILKWEAQTHIKKIPRVVVETLLLSASNCSNPGSYFWDGLS